MHLEATPTINTVPLRAANFNNLAEALDYAARGVTGCNFYTGRGELYSVLPYSELRQQAMQLARRLLSFGCKRGSRITLIADTHPDFLRFFYACQYAGLVPVALPIPVTLGSHNAYVEQINSFLRASKPSVAIAPEGYLPLLEEAACGIDIDFVGSPEQFNQFPEGSPELVPSGPDELAYLQFTSGSTRFPRGVMIDQKTVMSNLTGIATHGVKLREGDRCVSWLPYYHDMGLVGLVLVPISAQVSADYLGTREFAMRPRQWLNLMSRNKATISFGPPFGYELCERRLRVAEAEKLDLSAWRVAGVGAEMIRSSSLERFAEALAPAGFDRKAFIPCYGMAECSLAISFADLDKPIEVDTVDADYLADTSHALPVNNHETSGIRTRSFVDCGKLLPGYEIEVRDADGLVLSDRNAGSIYLRGDSVMSGYYENPEASAEALSGDGWLNTGDIGYLVEGRIFITGREKDLIIINGRNIWPQDLEYIAEQQDDVRPGDALAFAAPGPEIDDIAVMVVQSRETDEAKRKDLVDRLENLVRNNLGIECYVELAPIHTLPRTSSGKLSRSKARQNFIDSHRWDQQEMSGRRAS
ncbi:MAG TPA: fatty acyl-AMP ligase [Crenotrichaceae bacterium]|nr:fatty acyl-AMP ligase [Crenotrichaceae bacterium]